MTEKIEILTARASLAGSIFQPKDSSGKYPAVLFVHGWKTGQDTLFTFAASLAEQGFVCLTFDLQGHGGSEGDLENLTFQDFIDNVVTAYDFLSQRSTVDSEQVSVIGSSFGAYLAVQLLSQRKVSRLVMRVPTDYPDNHLTAVKLQTSGNQVADEWRQSPHDCTASSSLRAIHEFSGDVLIVESEKDTVVPHQTVQNYIDAAADKSKLTHIVMRNAPHSLSKHPEFIQEYANILKDWFGKTL